jgi:hypothetical protein
MEFFDWSILGTYAGAMLAVSILTELTKSIPGINKIPTQLWSYILALIVLIGSQAVGGTLEWATAGLSAINAAMVSLAANGGYEALDRLANGKK